MTQLSKRVFEMPPRADGVTAADGGPPLATVAIVDLSPLPRFGVKGPGAEGALRALGFALPTEPNRWAVLDGGGLVARLGRSEFLIEEDIAGGQVGRVREALADGAPGVYPVPRFDLALALVGPNVQALWDQTCSFDARELAATPGLVVLTTMIGVSVTVLRTEFLEHEGLRIWCDGTFGRYFFETLTEIARELGGGIAGIGDLFPDAPRLATA